MQTQNSTEICMCKCCVNSEKVPNELSDLFTFCSCFTTVLVMGNVSWTNLVEEHLIFPLSCLGPCMMSTSSVSLPLVLGHKCALTW